MSKAPPKLAKCISDFDRLLSGAVHEAQILADGRDILAQLVSTDGWLDHRFARPHPDHYVQYLLYLDPDRRFSISTFVWEPGQSTPIHNHTVWGLIGTLRGAELNEDYQFHEDRGSLKKGRIRRLEAGDVTAVSPSIGDIHRVSNAFADRVTISVHVYGADISSVERSVFQSDGRRSAFRSTYANADDTPAYHIEDLLA